MLHVSEWFFILDYYNFKLYLISVDINYTDTNGLRLLRILLESRIELNKPVKLSGTVVSWSFNLPSIFGSTLLERACAATPTATLRPRVLGN